ncbi:hypothetical protein chiPu_0024419, partial [Chiloscyllium punctatum]|nr:hypothetical protein [Chiloscyllium punctatum]
KIMRLWTWAYHTDAPPAPGFLFQVHNTAAADTIDATFLNCDHQKEQKTKMKVRQQRRKKDATGVVIGTKWAEDSTNSAI